MHTGTRSWLPRLPRAFYQADAVILWTLPIQHRATGWLSPGLHQDFRELMLHAAAREHLLCPIYCLMPDHIHLLWMGLHLDSDQRNGMAFLRTWLEPALSGPKFQVQAHDHVFSLAERKQKAFAAVCSYIWNNPVRAQLVKEPELWPYTGALIPGYPKLNIFEPGHWEKFWKLYYTLRDPKCSERKLPPRTTEKRPRGSLSP